MQSQLLIYSFLLHYDDCVVVVASCGVITDLCHLWCYCVLIVGVDVVHKLSVNKLPP